MALDPAAVRARLLEEGDRDWAELWPVVLGARLDLLRALAPFDEEQARRRPTGGVGEGAWSAFEIARHVLAYTDNVLGIIEATARGLTVPKDPMGTLAPAAPTFAGMLAEVVGASARLATVHERVPRDLHGAGATVAHAVFGELPSRAWFAFLALHDSDHLQGVRRLTGQAGLPG